MSSLFELEDRLRRLRETLAHVKQVTLENAGEIRAANGEDQAGEEWRLFLAELRDYASLAEDLGAASTRASKRLRQPAAAEPALAKRLAVTFEAEATLH